MNFKFFGNSLDLFKYDILINTKAIELAYIAMLTEPEEKRDTPKYKLYEIGSKNEELLEFLRIVNIENLTVSKVAPFLKKNIRNIIGILSILKIETKSIFEMI